MSQKFDTSVLHVETFFKQKLTGIEMITMSITLQKLVN